MDTKMYLPPKDHKKMSPEQVGLHALHWAADAVFELAALVGQLVPRGYVQIRQEPETGDEWLHYGTRWMDADITDTKVKLAYRPERLDEERQALAATERQIDELRKVCEDQRRRIKALDIQDQ